MFSARRPVDRVHLDTRHGLPADSGLLPFNGDRMRVVGNSNGVVAGGATERRLGVVSVYGGDISWIPTVGNPSSVQFTGRRIAAVGGRIGRTARRGRSRCGTRAARRARCGRTTTSAGFRRPAAIRRCSSRPTARSVAFVSDRTRLDSRLRHAGERHVRVAGEAADDRRLSGRTRRLVARQHANRLSPQRGRAIRWSASSTSSMSRPGKTEPIVTEHGVNYDPAFSPDGATLVFHRTDVENSLDLYTVAGAARSRRFVRLSDSMPAGLDKADLTPPVAVSFPSRLDKKPVPATLMVSKRHRSHAETSGARLDSRLGLGSEFPRLASGQLPHVLLAVPVPRAAGLRRS